MISKALQKARDFEKKYLKYTLSEQPAFHVTGGIGWINDPNGFAPYKGEYHLFFQYYPYDTKWGPMHWGHVKTRDFIKWERLPAALAPDMDYDRDGCFSGGAVEMPDGRHLLMYTGVRNIRRRNGKLQAFQTQCVAVGDGVDYEKYSLNPVIDARLLPEGGSTEDFRDPKIWREDGQYYVALGNRCADGSGTILIYRSDDALNWEFVNVLSACHNQYGRMWECPDVFRLDGKDVLLVSPQEMAAIGLEFHPGNANVCLVGTCDRESFHLHRDWVQAIDYGLDFYAPQTLQTADGRRVMIAWMQNWETSSCKPQELRFMGQMTLPRELSIRGGRLYQNPVRELEKYRGVKIDYYNGLINGEPLQVVPPVCGPGRRAFHHDPFPSGYQHRQGGPDAQRLPPRHREHPRVPCPSAQRRAQAARHHGPLQSGAVYQRRRIGRVLCALHARGGGRRQLLLRGSRAGGRREIRAGDELSYGKAV